MFRLISKIPLKNNSIGKKVPYHSKFLIVGAGDGGVSTATYLRKNVKNTPQDITLIDPNTEYIYQSGLTMVGGGIKPLENIKIKLSKRLPQGVNHVQQQVTSVKPDQNLVICEDGTELSYEYLVLSVGINPRLDLIKGLKEALEDENIPVATNYLPASAKKMYGLIKNFRGGKALFSMPSTPIKCAGAPLKVMFLSANEWKNKNLNSEINFHAGTPKIFSNPYYLPALENIARDYGINLNTESELIEINSKTRTAKFKQLNDNSIKEENFDLMHVTPIMKTPNFLNESQLVSSNGFVDVNINTLQHNKYKNIFALGDCANLPISKTLSAVNDQFHIVVRNIEDMLKGKEPSNKYFGYTGCPIFVGDKKVMLCEFGYNNRIMPTFLKDQRKPRKMFYHLKVNIFDKLALYNLCGIIRPIRQTLSKFPYDKHRDYKA